MAKAKNEDEFTYMRVKIDTRSKLKNLNSIQELKEKKKVNVYDTLDQIINKEYQRKHKVDDFQTNKDL